MRNKNISLMGLLAIVTCVAIGISHVITSVQLARVNRELAELRQRLELMPVANADHIAARRLPSTDEHVQRWSVRIPEGCRQQLYANWGTSSLANIQATKAAARTFQLAPDPATREATIRVAVERNPNDATRGSITIDTGDVSMISLGPEITSLLMGERPSRSEAIGDAAVTRSAASPITLFAVESASDPKASFCLWLDEPTDDEAGAGGK